MESESAKLALRDLQERHQELLKLEKGIQEMHDMFLELNLMIESQVKGFNIFNVNSRSDN